MRDLDKILITFLLQWKVSVTNSQKKFPRRVRSFYHLELKINNSMRANRVIKKKVHFLNVHELWLAGHSGDAEALTRWFGEIPCAAMKLASFSSYEIFSRLTSTEKSSSFSGLVKVDEINFIFLLWRLARKIAKLRRQFAEAHRRKFN